MFTVIYQEFDQDPQVALYDTKDAAIAEFERVANKLEVTPDMIDVENDLPVLNEGETVLFVKQAELGHGIELTW